MSGRQTTPYLLRRPTSHGGNMHRRSTQWQARCRRTVNRHRTRDGKATVTFAGGEWMGTGWKCGGAPTWQAIVISIDGGTRGARLVMAAGALGGTCLGGGICSGMQSGIFVIEGMWTAVSGWMVAVLCR